MSAKQPFTIEQLLNSLDLAEIGIWHWDIRSGEEWWTDGYFKVLGYEVGEVPANYDTFLNKLLHPSHRQKVQDAIEAHFDQNKPFRVPMLLLRKDGNYGWYLLNGQSRRDESGKPIIMAGSIVDISEEMAIREELERNELFLEETGELARVGGWEVDLTSMTTKWTKPVYDIHEVPYGEVITVEDGINFYHPEDRERISEDFNRCVSERKSFNDIYRFITRNDREIYVRAVGIPVTNDQDEVVGVQGVFQDIDEQKRAEVLVEETLAVTTEQNEKLINFSHIVSHNLRNHSSNLEMLVDFIRESESEEDKKDLLNKVGEVVSNLSDTIQHLNEVVSLQTQIEKKSQHVNLHDAIQKVIDVCTGDLRAAHAIVDIDVDQSAVVDMNPAYLDSILLNLVSNAIRYRKRDTSLTLKIKAKKKDAYMNLSVSDNGMGIDLKRHRSRIFQLHGVLRTHAESRGVGLYISKNQIESIGGFIDVESELGKGSTFVVGIPMS